MMSADYQLKYLRQGWIIMIRELSYLVFDIEVYPEWFCIVIKNHETGKKFICRSDFGETVKQLANILGVPSKKNVYTGFNIKGYDLKILYHIISDYNQRLPMSAICQRTYELNQRIIESHDDSVRVPYNFVQFTDLTDDLPAGFSLKEYESNSGLPIKETSVPFGTRNLTQGQRDEIVFYCEADVDAEDLMLTERWNYIQTKVRLADRFDIQIEDALKKTDPSLTSSILVRRKGYTRNEIIPDSALTYTIPLPVNDYIRDYLPLDIINKFTDYSNFNKIDHLVMLADNQFTIGLGGAHSVHKKNNWGKNPKNNVLFVEKKPNMVYVIIDVQSYYPHLISIFNYQSRNTTDFNLYPSILEERMANKAKMLTMWDTYGKDVKEMPEYVKLTQDVGDVKLILNATGGALREPHLSYYDPQNNLGMCFTGQLLLMTLCNELHNKCYADIIQTNTDGIVMRFPYAQRRAVYTRIKQWESRTNMTFDINTFNHLWQNNVNNYVLILDNGKIKNVGGWLGYKIDHFHNVQFNIIKKAMFNYLVYNKPIRDTVLEEKDGMMFMQTVKAGNTFDKVIFINRHGTEVANKVNRIYATRSINGGSLKKVKGNRQYSVANCPTKTMLANDKVDSVPNDIDYDWYINKAQSKINELIRIDL